jgi:hypothetical protein
VHYPVLLTMRPNAAQVERARTLLASEGGSASDSEACAAAAGRIYDKLDAHLAPLIGRAGVQALFARSARLAQSELVPLTEVAAGADGSTKLRAHLQSLEPAVAIETAAALFGTFLDLITTFIGERLTVQVLRNAWPAMKETAPRETPR